MGMKRKRLVYIRKFGNKFAAWLKRCKRIDTPVVEPTPVAEPAPVVEPSPVLWPPADEHEQEKE